MQYLVSVLSGRTDGAPPTFFHCDATEMCDRKMYAVKGWSEFQHYKDRNPPWLKLHRGLLDNVEYFTLSPESGKALPLIWILASEKNGIIPIASELAFRLRIPKDAAEAISAELFKAGFLRLATDHDNAEQFATPAQQAGWGSRHIPDKVKVAVWKRDCGKCQHCSTTENIEYDHVTPVSAGGNSEESNIQLLCRSCNRKKRTSLGRRSIETETEGETENRDRKQKQFFNAKAGVRHGKEKPTGGDEGQRIAEKYLSQVRAMEA